MMNVIYLMRSDYLNHRKFRNQRNIQKAQAVWAVINYDGSF
jgi:hypothetical protein